MQTRGVVFLHSSPPAVCPHAEWAVSAALSTPVRLEWVDQPAAPGTLRAEYVWHGPSASASKVATALRAWPMLRFEVTEEPTAGTDGERIAHVPGRGLHRTQVSASGDVVVTENQIRALLAKARSGDDYAHGLSQLIGDDWDADLETYRHGGDGAPVTWMAV